jgi:hypothetical protein
MGALGRLADWGLRLPPEGNPPLTPARKTRLLLLLVTTVCIAGAALAGVRLRGRGSFSGTVAQTPLAGNQVDLQITASGNVTHLGRSRLTLHTAADLNGTVPVAVPPSLGTVTAANGDTISFVLKWTTVPATSGDFLVEGPFQVAGGTGRFAGVTGGGIYRGRFNFNNNTVSADIEGEIVRPGK